MCNVCSSLCCRDAKSPGDPHCGAPMALLRALQGDKTRFPVLHRHVDCLALPDFIVPEGTGKGRLEIGKFSSCPPWHPTQGLPPSSAHC